MPGSPTKRRRRPAVLRCSGRGLRLRLKTWLRPQGVVEAGEHALFPIARGVLGYRETRADPLGGRLDRSLRTVDSLEDDE